MIFFVLSFSMVYQNAGDAVSSGHHLRLKFLLFFHGFVFPSLFRRVFPSPFLLLSLPDSFLCIYRLGHIFSMHSTHSRSFFSIYRKLWPGRKRRVRTLRCCLFPLFSIFYSILFECMREDLSCVLYALHKTMQKWHFLNSPFTLISWRRKSSWAELCSTCWLSDADCWFHFQSASAPPLLPCQSVAL